jgi:hypothetical protein
LGYGALYYKKNDNHLQLPLLIYLNVFLAAIVVFPFGVLFATKPLRHQACANFIGFAIFLLF